MGTISRRQGTTRGRRLVVVLVAASAVLVLGACRPTYVERPITALWGRLDPASTLIGCERAAERLVVAGPVHLDPSCTYTGGVEISTSGTVLDCRGARIEDVAGNRSRGIAVTTPNDVALTDVTIRNCLVKGFLNTVRVTRPDFRSLPVGAEYEQPTSDIVIEHSRLYGSRGSGIFVDAFVTGVTIRHVEVAGAGSVGIYLEAGSKDNVIEDSRIHSNGYKDVRPEGVPFTLNGVEYRYASTGREGIAVDGSRNNVIRRNRIAGNASGGIYLYKNCGEYANDPGHWVRRYGAHGNLIEGNVIRHERNGVWIASRMAENQVFMECSDQPMLSAPFKRVYADPARGNVVRGNTFEQVARGVRVEDSANQVVDNTFTSTDPLAQAVVVGTLHRTTVLGRPVAGTVVTGNAATIVGNDDPFHWVHGHDATTFSGNTTHGAPATLTEGVPPAIDPFLFVIDFWPAT